VLYKTGVFGVNFIWYREFRYNRLKINLYKSRSKNEKIFLDLMDTEDRSVWYTCNQEQRKEGLKIVTSDFTCLDLVKNDFSFVKSAGVLIIGAYIGWFV
jgi:hypothetical protein